MFLFISTNISANNFENGFWKLLAEILVETNQNILDLVFIIFCLNRNECCLMSNCIPKSACLRLKCFYSQRNSVGTDRENIVPGNLCIKKA